MNFGIASFIGNTLEKFGDLEMEDSGRAWGSSLRICVALNVTQPLIRALRVCTTMGVELVVLFTYERSYNFCYLCWCLGHMYSYCELRFEVGFQDPGEEMPYGAWLRAPPGSRVPRKAGKSSDPPPAGRSSQSNPTRGPGVFDFGNAHGPGMSNAAIGKRVAPENSSSNHSKQQGDSGDKVHSVAV
ncbi:UNVERIFIED_CONTAM: hypothetical protein Slati_3114900 [Sesamum latifolium]|uniref:Zinc knuckle CX2CX4HX4C domain-containing protein n=1 Tax=Sesamum latifolium TaxID=2727402 RepID=A0AAW2UVH1_9LAMI